MCRLTLDVLPDEQPPKLTQASPANGAFLPRLDDAVVRLEFDEPVVLDSTGQHVSAVGTGPDEVFDTADDTTYDVELTLLVAINSVRLRLLNLDKERAFRISVNNVADAAGNMADFELTYYFAATAADFDMDFALRDETSYLGTTFASDLRNGSMNSQKKTEGEE